jgi:hypothetical protein
MKSRERAEASEPGARRGVVGSRERASRGAPGGEASRIRRMRWPTKTQQIGLVLVLAILVLLALARALAPAW